MPGCSKEKKQHRQQTYPYLSIDQLKKEMPKDKGCVQVSSQYLNIRLDLKNQLREKELKSFNQRLSYCLTRNQPHLDKSEKKETSKKHNNNKSFSYKKDLANPQRIMLLIDQLLVKEDICQKITELTSQNKERYPYTFLEPLICKQQDKNSSKMAIKSLGSSQSDDKIEGSTKWKKQVFHRMLKKCEKLKEIYKYQNQLIKIKEIKEIKQGDASIRFYTEPIKVDLNDCSLEKELQRYREEMREINRAKTRKIASNKSNSRSEKKTINDQVHQDEEKTLEIRRYKNDSVMKQRLKYMVKRNMMKMQSDNQKKRVENQVKPKFSNIEKNSMTELWEMDLFGPWDQQEAKIQFKL